MQFESECDSGNLDGGPDEQGDGIVPEPTIKSVSNTGLIHIRWSVDMKPTENLNVLTSGKASKRLILVYLVPGSEDSKPEQLGLNDY